MSIVQSFQGEAEVWAVERRPNQLEDRLGAEYALGDPTNLTRLTEAFQFYFADVNQFGPEFPGPGDFDIDDDGEEDPATQLTDRFGSARGGGGRRSGVD